MNNFDILSVQSANGPIDIYYASISLSDNRSERKNLLANWLLKRAGVRVPAECNGQLIKNDGNGCPHLNGGIQHPIALSFSQSGQEIWAAIAQAGALGLDVESPENFRVPYPYGRVFSGAEFQCVAGWCRDREDAAAMLWSCKEAAMKNRGTGFHFTDPRAVRIQSCMLNEPLIFTVSVATPGKISVTVIRKQHLWLAIAVSL